MTQNRLPRLAALALAALVLAGMALLTQVAFTTQAPAVATVATVEPTRIDAIPAADALDPADQRVLAAAFGAGSDYTAEQAQAALETADRVCEGFAARTPVDGMASEIAALSGLTLDQAWGFLDAAAYRC